MTAGKLLAAIREHRAEFEAAGAQAEEMRTLPPATVSLLATAREALTNAAKHAPNTPVDVNLDYHPDTVTLKITNAAQDRDDRSGYGLTGMRERIALVGGTLTAGYNATRWRVVAEVPE